jgi:hypothetical protein
LVVTGVVMVPTANAVPCSFLLRMLLLLPIRTRP